MHVAHLVEPSSYTDFAELDSGWWIIDQLHGKLDEFNLLLHT